MNDERSDPRNYKPASLLSVGSKVFETFINDVLISHLTKTGLLVDSHYGFRSSGAFFICFTLITEKRYSEAPAVALLIRYNMLQG